MRMILWLCQLAVVIIVVVDVKIIIFIVIIIVVIIKGIIQAIPDTISLSSLKRCGNYRIL